MRLGADPAGSAPCSGCGGPWRDSVSTHVARCSVSRLQIPPLQVLSCWGRLCARATARWRDTEQGRSDARRGGQLSALAVFRPLRGRDVHMHIAGSILPVVTEHTKQGGQQQVHARPRPPRIELQLHQLERQSQTPVLLEGPRHLRRGAGTGGRASGSGPGAADGPSWLQRTRDKRPARDRAAAHWAGSGSHETGTEQNVTRRGSTSTLGRR